MFCNISCVTAKQKRSETIPIICVEEAFQATLPESCKIMERFAAFDPPEPGPVYRKTVRERTAITIVEWFSLNISLECVAKAFCCYV